MQSVSTLTANYKPSITASKAANEDNAAAYIERLFTRLLEIYPTQSIAWRNHADLTADKCDWTREMLRAGVMDATLIKRGLQACKLAANNGERWLPSVHLFIGRCKTIDPETLGLPSVDAAFNEACKHHSNKWHSWTHKAVYWAATAISQYDYSANNEKWLKSEFSRFYAIQVNRVANGELLPEAALPTKPVRPEKSAPPSGFFSELLLSLG